jgi:uncharacterized delta-60 repeat protein
MAVLENGDIIYSTATSAPDGWFGPPLLRVKADGQYNPEFFQVNYEYNTDYTTLLAVPGGLLASGPELIRVGMDGRRDPTFNAATWSFVAVLLRQPDGKILVGGDYGITRILPDGSADPAFTEVRARDGGIRTVALQSDGRIIVGGDFGRINEFSRQRLARIHPDGSLDMGFVAAADGPVHSLAVQRNDKILVAGAFTSLADASRQHLGRLLPDGTMDADFKPDITAEATWLDNNGYDPDTSSLHLFSDGSILLSGPVTSFNGVPCYGLVRLIGDPVGRFGAAEPSPAGLRLRLSVPRHRRVEIEASTNFIHWTPISTNKSPSGTVDFTDPATPGLPRRFYRVR